MGREQRQSTAQQRVKRWFVLALAGAVLAVGLSAQATARPPVSGFVAAERVCSAEGGAFIIDNEFAGAGYVCGWGQDTGGPRQLFVAERLCRTVYGGSDFWLTQFIAVSYTCYIEPG